MDSIIRPSLILKVTDPIMRFIAIFLVMFKCDLKPSPKQLPNRNIKVMIVNKNLARWINSNHGPFLVELSR